MASPTRPEGELARLRSDLAGLAVTLGWARVERTLLLKYREDQPREPAGQPGGGRWTSGGSSDATAPNDGREPDTTGSRTQEEVVAEDGTRVLTIRIRDNRKADWDEQHTVTTPDGASAILGRSTPTDAGLEPEAFVQTVRSPLGLGNTVARAIEAAGVLFATLSGRNDRFGKTIFEAPASEYPPGDTLNDRPIWVGPVESARSESCLPAERRSAGSGRRDGCACQNVRSLQECSGVRKRSPPAHRS